MNIEEVDLAVAVKITPGATGALADIFPLILKQDSEVISVDITITIYVPNALDLNDGEVAIRILTFNRGVQARYPEWRQRRVWMSCERRKVVEPRVSKTTRGGV